MGVLDCGTIFHRSSRSAIEDVFKYMTGQSTSKKLVFSPAPLQCPLVQPAAIYDIAILIHYGMMCQCRPMQQRALPSL